MTIHDALTSEEDVRSKVVCAWLGEHGFTAEDIEIEKTFEIQLGRGVFRVQSDSSSSLSATHQVIRPRADLLVKTHDNRNLLIIEVKAPDEVLTDNDRRQAVSYARLLTEGGIAPFTVLTNGVDTRVYDTLSGDQIDGQRIPLNHPFVRSGFRVSGEDIAFRAEALEHLISLTSDNFLAFCRSQCEYRMKRLRGTDIYCGKKYIPDLYVERSTAKEELDAMLWDKRKRFVVIVGAPQHGKTCFVCRRVEEYLSAGEPCLFFPAVDISQGLLEALCEDFDYTFGGTTAPLQLIKRLTRVLNSSGKRLTLFIDGWNEASREAAFAIDEACRRLSCLDITVVLSATNTALNRLLRDTAGNLTFVAEQANLDERLISTLRANPERDMPQVAKISIGEYQEEEATKAFELLSQAYGVQPGELHSSHYNPVHRNPFYLRGLMEMHAGGTLTSEINVPQLIHEIVQRKARRSGIAEEVVHSLLETVANAVVRSRDCLLLLSKAQEALRLPVSAEILPPLFDAAILALVHDSAKRPAIDFYYSGERNYFIAFVARDWPQVLCSANSRPERVLEELRLVENNPAALDAFKWFLSLPENAACAAGLERYGRQLGNSQVTLVLLASIYRHNRKVEDNDQQMLLAAIDWCLEQTDDEPLEEGARLILRALSEQGSQRRTTITDQERTWLSSLLKADVYLGGDVLDVFKFFHEKTEEGYMDDLTSYSLLIELMTQIMQTDERSLRSQAATVLAYIQPWYLMQLLSKNLSYQPSRDELDIYEHAVDVALGEIKEAYYGGYCPGIIEYLEEPEDFERERGIVRQYCSIVAVAYYPSSISDAVLKLENDLHPDEDADSVFTVAEAFNDTLASRYQLTLEL